jgi:hypothetical protein
MVRHDGPGEINTWFQEVPARVSSESTTPASRFVEHVRHVNDLGRVPGADGLVECCGLEISMVRHDGLGEINTWFQKVPARASSTTPVSRFVEHLIHENDLGRVPCADGLVECYGLEI